MISATVSKTLTPSGTSATRREALLGQNVGTRVPRALQLVGMRGVHWFAEQFPEEVSRKETVSDEI